MKPKLQLKTAIKTTQKLKLKRVLLISSITTGVSVFAFLFILWFNNFVPTIDSKAGTNNNFSIYNWSKTISIKSNTELKNNVYNYPILISIKDNDLRTTEFGGLLEDANAKDIAIFNQNLNKKLNHKIKKFNPKTGEIDVWILIDTLFSNSETNLNFEFGSTSNEIINIDSIFNSTYVGIWDFDESNIDLSSNYNDGTTVNSSKYISGIKNKSLKLEGETEHVVIQKHNSLDLTTEGTLSTWIYLEEYLNYGGIIHKGDKKNWSDEAYMLQLWNNQKLLFAVNNENTQQQLYSSKINTKTWYYVVATWNAEGMKIYLNGKLDAEYNKGIVARKTTGNLHIGAQLEQNFSSSLKNLPFKGIIDEVQILNKALSIDQISINYNNLANYNSFVKISETKKNNNSLPFELSDFSANYVNNKVVIDWTTNSEKNNQYFEIEKSYDGIIYIAIKKIEGHGNSYEKHYYSSSDNDMSEETCFYRLKQVDDDGKFEYFGPLSVKKTNLTPNVKIEVDNVYPNPFSDILNIDIVSENAKEVEITILDMNGRLVKVEKVQLSDGFNNIHLTENIGKLLNGTYIVDISNNNKTVKSFKIFKH